MGGHSSPLTCCDSDCAGVNNCVIGGVQCECCGMWFCSSEVDENGNCGDCASIREEHTCEECGAYDSDMEIYDGLCFDCLCEINPVKALIVKCRELASYSENVGKVNFGFGCAARGHANDIEKVANGFVKFLDSVAKGEIDKEEISKIGKEVLA